MVIFEELLKLFFLLFILLNDSLFHFCLFFWLSIDVKVLKKVIDFALRNVVIFYKS